MPGSSSPQVFLSYRRADTSYARLLLKTALQEQFPDMRVFMDLDSVEPGLDFAEVIRQAVDSCSVLLAFMVGKWATCAHEEAWTMLGNATSTVPLPADTIRPGEIGQCDFIYVAAVLLTVIAWLLTIAGPVMISKLPQVDQSTMTDYYGGIPGLAVTLTAYLITHRPKGK